MPRLILVLRDLYLERLGDSARAALPRLAQLEYWLTHGAAHALAGDWRQWLQRQARSTAVQAAPPASIAAAAVPGVAEGAPVWLATPVHLIAGLDTVRVHPAGLLQLADEEQVALAEDFATVFAGSGWHLHVTGRREMLLAGGPALDRRRARSQDPARWLGSDPREGLPAGPEAGALRRLGAEMEMWLHDHPVNRSRGARGLLAANALWVWGGGACSLSPQDPKPTAESGALARADDLFVDGLARLEGATVHALPARWPSTPAIHCGSEQQLVVVCEWGAGHPGEDALQALERDWIAPALEQWRRGQWREAVLLAGRCAAILARGRPGRSLWRRFRRARPWWETLLQC